MVESKSKKPTHQITENQLQVLETNAGFRPNMRINSQQRIARVIGRVAQLNGFVPNTEPPKATIPDEPKNYVIFHRQIKEKINNSQAIREIIEAALGVTGTSWSDLTPRQQHDIEQELKGKGFSTKNI